MIHSITNSQNMASDRSLTDVSGTVGGWLFEDPKRILTPDVESGYRFSHIHALQIGRETYA